MCIYVHKRVEKIIYSNYNYLGNTYERNGTCYDICRIIQARLFHSGERINVQTMPQHRI